MICLEVVWRHAFQTIVGSSCWLIISCFMRLMVSACFSLLRSVSVFMVCLLSFWYVDAMLFNVGIVFFCVFLSLIRGFVR